MVKLLSILAGVLVMSMMFVACIDKMEREEREEKDRLVTLRMKENLTYNEKKELAILELDREESLIRKNQSGQHAIGMGLAMNAGANAGRCRY